jgi:hypothetical protein
MSAERPNALRACESALHAALDREKTALEVIATIRDAYLRGDWDSLERALGWEPPGADLAAQFVATLRDDSAGPAPTDGSHDMPGPDTTEGGW